MKYLVIFLITTGFAIDLPAQLKKGSDDMIGAHRKIRSPNGKVLAWYKPNEPGAGYDHVVKLAASFIKSGTPVDPASGLPLYLIACCFEGPHMRGQEDFDKGITWENWMHNPACVYAGMVQSLVLDYRPYSGDEAYVDVVRTMLDYQLEKGTTPADWPWPNVPYASSNPGDKIYVGATEWESDGMRGDGLHGIEPDKIGELGMGYLRFYQVTLEQKYLRAAIHCADALAKHVRDVRPERSPFAETSLARSPWPFRVNARTNIVISEYCSNIIEPVRLLDELLRIKARIHLTTEQTEAYGKARSIAMEWLYSKNGPIISGIWNGYFEDVPNDPHTSNRIQLTPLETARYLIKNPSIDPDLRYTIPALLNWVAVSFRTEDLDAIKEQTWCYEPMGSHTARYASICALWYDYTGDSRWKEEAFNYFNVATYMTDPNGVVRVGPDWPGTWFSDGYSDYIRHFMEGLAAIPEWAPSDKDYFLQTTSVVQKIQYSQKEITFSTFDDDATDVLRLTNKPKAVLVNGQRLQQRNDAQQIGWRWKPLAKGGVLKIRRQNGGSVKIEK